MARTIRRQPKGSSPRHYHPTKRARAGERRATRQAERQELRGYVR